MGVLIGKEKDLSGRRRGDERGNGGENVYNLF